MNWIVYNELAWTDNVLACLESYEEDMNYAKLTKEFISVPFPTMLHLGYGAGGYDFHFNNTGGRFFCVLNLTEQHC